jgi:hypothetical protein
VEIKIGKHTYKCEEITVREEMSAIALYRTWVQKQGLATTMTDELQNHCRTLAVQSYMIKEIDGKQVESPEFVFKHLMELPARDRLSIWVVNGRLNEGTDFLALMGLRENKTDDDDKSLSASDSQDTPLKSSKTVQSSN